MDLRIIGSANMSRVESYCTQHYQCEPTEFSIIKDMDNFIIRISHNRSVDSAIFTAQSGDNMSFNAAFLPPLNAGKMTPYEELYTKTFEGIDESLIKTDLFKTHYNQMSERILTENAVVALGKYPENGRDIQIKLFFEQFEGDKDVSVHLGKTDYKHLNKYVSVRAGQLLAKIIPATKGVEGLDLSGKVLSVVDGNETTLSAGEGVIKNEETFEYHSETDGYVIYSGTAISVKEVLNIKGNVNYSVGNIDFIGTVMIDGDIMPGFMVKGRDVIVRGLCQGASIVAENDIDVMGVKSAEGKHSITAGNNLTVGFCENSRIYAKNDVIITKYTYNSTIHAGNRIDASNKTTVAGCDIVTFAGGVFYNLGTKVNTNVKISVGKKYDIVDKLARIREERFRLVETLHNIEKGLSKLNMPEEVLMQNPKIKKILDTKALILKRLELFEKREESLKKESAFDSPSVKVLNDIHEGVVIRIFDMDYAIPADTKNVEFVYDKINLAINVRPAR